MSDQKNNALSDDDHGRGGSEAENTSAPASATEDADLDSSRGRVVGDAYSLPVDFGFGSSGQGAADDSQASVSVPGAQQNNHLGLRRLILLDSYIRRCRAELKIDGHVSVTGRNASGKTSLIRILPLFFGAEPGHLVRNNSGSHHTSFSGFYLPGDGSYLVFEYATAQGLNMAVFITDGRRDTLRPILISGAFAPELFLDSDNHFLNKDDLVRRARAAGHEVHDARTIRAYVDIVWGGARRRGSSPELARFNILVGLDGGSSGRSMTDVHHLLTATLDSKVDERLLQLLLLKQAQRMSDIDDDSLSGTDLDPEKVLAWVDDYRGMREARGLRKHATQAITAGNELARLSVSEVNLREAMERRAEKALEEKEGAADHQRQLELQGNALNQTHAEARRAYEDEISAARQSARDLKNAVEALESQESDFRKRGVAAALEEAGELEVRKAALESAQNQAALIKRASRDIDVEFDESKNDAAARLQSAEDRVRETERAALVEAEQQRQAVDERHEQERGALNTRLSEQQQALGKAHVDAQSALSKIQGQISAVDADPALLGRRDRLAAERDDAEKEVAALRQAHADAEKHLSDVRMAADRNARALSDARREHKVATDEHEQLAKAMERAGTLLAFVRENVPDWQSTIAATLSKGRNLLYETNLSPRLSESGEHGLFGVQIDTSRLSPVDVESADKVHLAELARAVGHWASEASRYEKAVADDKQRIKSAETAERKALAAYRRVEGRYASLKTALGEIGDQIIDSKERRKAAFDAELEAARDRAAHGEQALDRGRAEGNQSLSALGERQRAERGELQSRESEIKDRCRSDLRGLRAQYQKDLDDLEGLRQARLEEKGVDSRQVSKAESNLRIARLNLDSARDAQDLVDEYQVFRRRYDAEYHLKQTEFAEASQTVDAIERAWSGTKRKHLAEMSDIGALLSAARDRAVSASKFHEMLLQHLSIAPQMPTNEAFDEATVSALVEQSVPALIENNEECRRSGRSHLVATQVAMRNISREFAASSSRLVREAALQSSLARLVSGNDAGDLVAASRFAARFFGERPEEDVSATGAFPLGSLGEDHESTLREPTFGLAIEQYVNQMESLRQQVARQSTMLSRNCQRVIAHLDSFQSIRVSAEFDFTELEGFQATKAVHDAYLQFQEDRQVNADQRLMPQDSLASAAERFLQNLRSRPRLTSASLIEALHLEFRVKVEPDQPDIVCLRGASFKDAFSEGQRAIVTATVLVGFLEGSRRELPIAVPWMLDELLKLDERNTRGLADALKQLKIFLVSTSPDVGAALDTAFSRRYVIESVDREGSRLEQALLVELDAPRSEDDPVMAALAEHTQAVEDQA